MIHIIINFFLQLSPGRDGSDTDMEPTASQSADCEPTPPLQRHGSKSNFFLPPVENNESPRHPPPSQHRHPIHYPRGSPHPRPRYLVNVTIIFDARNALIQYLCITYSQRDEWISKSHTRPVITGDKWLSRHSPSTSGRRQPNDATTYQSYWSTHSACHIQSYTKVHHTYALLKEK